MHESQYQLSTQDVSSTVNSRNHAQCDHSENFYAHDKHLAQMRSSYILYLVSQFLLERAKKKRYILYRRLPWILRCLLFLEMDGFELTT